MHQILKDLNIDVSKANQKIDVGSVIKDRFILEQKIGCGGMGTVYRAKDMRRAEANAKFPYVAIKIISDRFKCHPKAFASLQHEATKTQDLHHPNIIQVYDFDRDGDIAFMTMEYLQGINLNTLMKNFAMQGLTYQQKVSILVKIAQALRYAHENNCIHGDLKPSNIFITNHNVVKLIDFGLANAFEGDSDFNVEELKAFTPAYASSEIASGDKPTVKDDIYAFACVAYEFLSGEHPYQKVSAKEAAVLEASPRKIRFMPQYQWKQLKNALQTNAKKRKVDLQTLTNCFTEKKSKKPLWWALGIIGVIAVFLIANQLEPII